MPQDDSPQTSKDAPSLPKELSAEEWWASQRQRLAEGLRWCRRERLAGTLVERR